MKFNLEMAMSIFWSIIVLCIIAGITLFVLMKFTPQDLCQSICTYHKGIYKIATDCNSDNILACSGWCEYDNKTVFCNDLISEINSSQSAI